MTDSVPMATPTRVRRLHALGIVMALAVLILDQASKWWILAVVMQPPQVIEVTPFFNLVMAWNRGVSFGLFTHEAEIMPYVLTAVALAIVAFLLVWLWRNDRALIAASLGLVIGGALGNVVDRFRFGAVADFLDFHVAGYHWPAFNVADSGITIGVALIVLDGLLGRHDTP